jgi:hypothetical protein
MAADCQIDCSLRVARPTSDDGKIGFLNLTVGKSLRERRVRLIILGHNNAAAGLLVQAMDNARAMLLRPGGEGSSVIQEGIDESAILMAGADMHDHASRFVNNKKISILVQNFQGDFLGSCSCRRPRWLLLDTKKITSGHLLIVFHRFSTQGDSS